MEVCEIYSEAEGSDPDPFSDDLEGDPDFDVTEETKSKFSNLSIEKKAAKTSIFYGEVSRTEIYSEEQKTEPGHDEEVQNIIEAGELEKLKVPECKLYLRKNGLRLTGNKDTLIQRIREHLEITNGGGEWKYPPSSFVQNCKGDACTGDVVLFEQNVYETFSIASRSASGPPCGKRIVAGRIVKESYGAEKQQHTFTIEVLWSKGEKPLPPLYPLLIKGRNLYRLKTLRQRWDDEGARRKILTEKHSRGDVARANREARKQEKERRKSIRENRVSKKELSSNQAQSHPPTTKSQYQHQESRCINPANQSQSHPPTAMSQYHHKESRRINPANHSQSHPLTTMSRYQHQESRCINPPKPKFFFDPGERIATRPDHFKEKLIINENYPCSAVTNRFAEGTYRRKPFTSANHLFPSTLNRETFKQKQPCKYYAQGRCHFGDNCKFSHGVRS
ncbi:zinc finger CCCH domain-containing protein 62-like [Prosopis cineraria]|uniref:zinc finger CCCH domain-containing protein 62-like n=1 Tax=Prosopis cineraria TaxID=364024 RepID=UPI00240F64AA|nr:zinc finger CCCH domain-containing protein 62-like [Prosopis cineraria]